LVQQLPLGDDVVGQLYRCLFKENHIDLANFSAAGLEGSHEGMLEPRLGYGLIIGHIG